MKMLFIAMSALVFVPLAGTVNSTAYAQSTPNNQQCTIGIGLNVRVQAPVFSPDMHGYPDTVTPPMMSTITVSEVAVGMPADRAGIQRGDVLAEVDGERVGNVNEPGLTLAQVSQRIKNGPAHSTVVITVERSGYRNVLRVERENICTPGSRPADQH